MLYLELLNKKLVELQNSEPFPNYQGRLEFERETDCWYAQIDIVEELIYEYKMMVKNETNTSTDERR